jgi:phosphonate transport system ATP-binding protein
VSAGAQAVIEARGLRIEVGAHLLLRDIALSISVGERVALVGRNGAGKSTLLRALTGFGEFGRLPRERLRVLGTDLADAHRREVLRTLRARVAQVHQSLHLVGRLSALDNVLIGGAARHSSPWTWLRRWPASEHDAAQAALARVGVGGAGGRRTDTLSGGERQKVAIARALHQGAPLLLADEPTASLDADAADGIAALLADVVRERGATLVCVVHDLDLLPRLADRAIALRHGTVAADMAVDAGTPERLRELLQ